MFNVIDRRYRTGKPLIINTNLELDDLIDEKAINKRRIYDRIIEMCVLVRFIGVSKRKENSDSKIKLLKELNSRN